MQAKVGISSVCWGSGKVGDRSKDRFNPDTSDGIAVDGIA
jgi:hypothetical protein